jgi:hypothetical protein
MPKPVLKWTDALVLEKFGKRKKCFNMNILKTFLSLKIFSRRDASVQFRMGFGISYTLIFRSDIGFYNCTSRMQNRRGI